MTQKTKNIIYNSLLAFLAIFVVLQVIVPDVGIKIFRFRTFIIADTGSMRPELDYPDFIVVTRSDYDTLKVKDLEAGTRGDYIAFYGYVGGRRAPITHEIVAKTEINGNIYYQTKGVNNESVDSRWISFDEEDGYNEYIGKFAFKVPVLGTAISFLRSVPGLIFLGVNIIAISSVVYIFKQSNKKETESLEKSETES